MKSDADALKHLIESSIELTCRYELADLALERELMETKWFGYRFMSPTAATLLFAKIYEEKTQEAVRRNRDRDLRVRAVNWVEYHSRGTIFTALWRARQRADLHCVPYETYISFSIFFASRRKRRFDPRPNQLHASVASAEAWTAEFATWCEQRRWSDCIRLDVPQLHRAHFRGLPPQIAYRDYVIATAKRAPASWKRIVELYCYERNEIDPNEFAALIDNDLFESIMSSLEVDLRLGLLEAKASSELQDHHFWTSCFGWPGCRDEQAAMCMNCPLSEKCKRVSDFASEKVKAVTGKLDPVEVARRNSQNERQKRCRDRKRAKAAVSCHSAAA